ERRSGSAPRASSTAIAAGRVPNPRAGAKKSLKRTRPYFDVPPFPAARSIVQDSKNRGIWGRGQKVTFDSAKAGVPPSTPLPPWGPTRGALRVARTGDEKW